MLIWIYNTPIFYNLDCAIVLTVDFNISLQWVSSSNFVTGCTSVRSAVWITDRLQTEGVSPPDDFTFSISHLHPGERGCWWVGLGTAMQRQRLVFSHNKGRLSSYGHIFWRICNRQNLVKEKDRCRIKLNVKLRWYGNTNIYKKCLDKSLTFHNQRPFFAFGWALTVRGSANIIACVGWSYITFVLKSVRGPIICSFREMPFWRLRSWCRSHGQGELWRWKAFNNAVDGDELTFSDLSIHRQLERCGSICRDGRAAWFSEGSIMFLNVAWYNRSRPWTGACPTIFSLTFSHMCLLYTCSGQISRKRSTGGQKSLHHNSDLLKVCSTAFSGISAQANCFWKASFRTIRVMLRAASTM